MSDGNLHSSQGNICLFLEKKNHIILEIKTKLKPQKLNARKYICKVL